MPFDNLEEQQVQLMATPRVSYTNSITHTQKEQGAWWQVDLGSKKNINQIIIYFRNLKY
jgi:hypothetical protein